uniref:PHLPPL protein n=1 Tax=Homo sapiens TaxID=9606 RepID=A1L3A0_HUMAN|nr:PHLPPL protein [Homo sapiens]
MKRNGSRNCLNRRSRFGSRERDWLREDVKRGCVYLYGADTTTATTTTLLCLPKCCDYRPQPPCPALRLHF